MLAPLFERLPWSIFSPAFLHIHHFYIMHQVAFDLTNGIPLVQVVAAVGFMGKRLEIPSHVNPQAAALIELCWAT